MKVSPPASEEERQRWRARAAALLGASASGNWRVDLYLGRYGWVARAVPLPHRMRGRARVNPNQGVMPTKPYP